MAEDDETGSDETEPRSGGLLRGRSTASLFLVAAVVVVALVATVVLVSDDDSDDDSSAAASTTTQPEDTTTTEAMVPVTEAPTTTTIATTTSVKGSTSTGGSKPPRRYGSECVEKTGSPSPPIEDWEEWYETEPEPDQPATAALCIDEIALKVGQSVMMDFVGSDPDARIVQDECGWEVRWGDEKEESGNLCRDFLRAPGEPVPTPKRERGEVEQVLTHAYTAPGTYTITGSVWSAEYDGRPHPYSSRAEVTLKVVVSA